MLPLSHQRNLQPGASIPLGVSVGGIGAAKSRLNVIKEIEHRPLSQFPKLPSIGGGNDSDEDEDEDEDVLPLPVEPQEPKPVTEAAGIDAIHDRAFDNRTQATYAMVTVPIDEKQNIQWVVKQLATWDRVHKAFVRQFPAGVTVKVPHVKAVIHFHAKDYVPRVLSSLKRLLGNIFIIKLYEGNHARYVQALIQQGVGEPCAHGYSDNELRLLLLGCASLSMRAPRTGCLGNKGPRKTEREKAIAKNEKKLSKYNEKKQVFDAAMAEMKAKLIAADKLVRESKGEEREKAITARDKLTRQDNRLLEQMPFPPELVDVEEEAPLRSHGSADEIEALKKEEEKEFLLGAALTKAIAQMTDDTSEEWFKVDKELLASEERYGMIAAKLDDLLDCIIDRRWGRI